ncbi:STM4014 family protein [Frankia sp. AiPs1]|uniref:STM4014 family protein n=1 Tax=Frankia sp. AiPs1 TaxID=573493 RepID=UPI002042FF7B|nr:STM4014 family protein [Frankia sp. AiPs1]MCM3920607.1 STM4014 family protein [Frankia sp. AiPs1]
MSPSPSSPVRFVTVGNPGNRRVTMFAAAVRAAGLPQPRTLAWREVLSGRYAFEPGEVVRIDSPGEDAEVDRLLRGADHPTRVEGTARWYRSFTAAVGAVARAATAAGAELLADPEDIAVMFDKRRCHARLSTAGIPVPEALPAPAASRGRETAGGGPTRDRACAGPLGGWDDLRERLGAARMPRAFVKPAHGSSASGVVALSLGGAGRVRATTSVEITPDGRLFNSLQVRQYDTEPEVAALIDALAPDGLHVERWLPKAALDGRPCDLRMVVVAGRVTHAVARTSRHPMTNLHLGGARGDLGRLRAAVDGAGGRWVDALSIAERAAACFPRTLCVGVDVLPAIGWRRFALGEVNAFGDLLPRLSGLAGGGAERLDTYSAQVAAVLRREEAHRGAA